MAVFFTFNFRLLTRVFLLSTQHSALSTSFSQFVYSQEAFYA